MPSLIDLRRRIRSVENTEQITKAMKMVSAAKLRRAQQAVVNARPYAALLESMIGSVLGQGGEDEIASNPLQEQRECRNVRLLVLAGEKGLCGSFNSSVLKAAVQFAGERADHGIEYELLGRKAVDFFAKRGERVTGKWEQVFAHVEHATATQVATDAMQSFRDGGADEVWILYNRFESVLTQDTTLEKLLPIVPPEAAAGGGLGGYEYEQPPEQLLGALLPKWVVTKVHLAMLDSAAAEHAARMTAMDAATRNAGEVLEKLRLHLNRVRQASITTEIIEIVSGATALE